MGWDLPSVTADKPTRRNVLKRGIGAGTAIAIATGIAQGKSGVSNVDKKTNISWSEFEANLAKKYSHSEARVATRLIKKEVKMVEKGNKSEEEAINSYREKLLKHPKTEGIASDIQSIISTNNKESL